MTSWFKKKRAKAKRKPDPHLIVFSSRGVMQRSQNMGKEREMKNETMAKT
jgi:predicted aconitase